MCRNNDKLIIYSRAYFERMRNYAFYIISKNCTQIKLRSRYINMKMLKIEFVRIV